MTARSTIAALALAAGLAVPGAALAQSFTAPAGIPAAATLGTAASPLIGQGYATTARSDLAAPLGNEVTTGSVGRSGHLRTHHAR